MKLIEDNPNEATDNGKRLSKEEKAVPSRSMSLDSNTIGMSNGLVIKFVNS